MQINLMTATVMVHITKPLHNPAQKRSETPSKTDDQDKGILAKMGSGPRLETEIAADVRSKVRR